MTMPPKRVAQRSLFRSWKLRAVIIVVLVGGMAVVFSQKAAAPSKSTNPLPHQAATQQTKPTTITLFATGDWIAHDSINAAALTSTGSYDYLPLIASTQNYFDTADIRFCNDPILNGGKALGIAGYPKFNSPTEFVTDMGRFGCNLVNLASNHSFDFTQANIDASVDAWAGVPNMLAYAGENKTPAAHDQVHYFTVKGVPFAFLAYTTYINNDAPVQNNYGVNVFDKTEAAQRIAEAKQHGAKFIIVSMRWGTEFTTTVNAEERADAQFLADHGVKLVLGHGSHELQPAEALTGADGGKTVVWYSLGNFLNTQLPAETLFNGIAGMTIDIKTLSITAATYRPIYMYYTWTPAEAAAQNTDARRNVKMYFLEDVTQDMINNQQLNTTVAAQRSRMQQTLATYGYPVSIISATPN